jgi:hypothetical protein
MQLFLNKFRRERLAASPLSRVLLALAALVLALQLIGSVVHKHDLTVDDAPDCVSCYVAAHLPTGAPPVNVVLQAIALVLVYRLARLPQTPCVARQSYLIPPSQAPPRQLPSA